MHACALANDDAQKEWGSQGISPRARARARIECVNLHVMLMD